MSWRSYSIEHSRKGAGRYGFEAVQKAHWGQQVRWRRTREWWNRRTKSATFATSTALFATNATDAIPKFWCTRLLRKHLSNSDCSRFGLETPIWILNDSFTSNFALNLFIHFVRHANLREYHSFALLNGNEWMIQSPDPSRTKWVNSFICTEQLSHLNIEWMIHIWSAPFWITFEWLGLRPGPSQCRFAADLLRRVTARTSCRLSSDATLTIVTGKRVNELLVTKMDLQVSAEGFINTHSAHSFSWAQNRPDAKVAHKAKVCPSMSRPLQRPAFCTMTMNDVAAHISQT